MFTAWALVTVVNMLMAVGLVLVTGVNLGQQETTQTIEG